MQTGGEKGGLAKNMAEKLSKDELQGLPRVGSSAGTSRLGTNAKYINNNNNQNEVSWKKAEKVRKLQEENLTCFSRSTNHSW